MDRKFNDCSVSEAIIGFDGPALYERMRVEDMLECIGLGFHPREACEQSYELSEKCYSIKTRDYMLIASFGVCPTDDPKVGCAWLLGTDLMPTIKKTFVKHSKEYLDELMGDYDYLTNIVSMNNKLSVRWLTWLGAEFGESHGSDYRRFIINRRNK
jgi:hypothetical protein